MTGLMLGFSDFSLSQIADNFAYTDHEKIEYNIYYNWGFIWLEAAEAYFKTDIKNDGGTDYLYLEGFGKTLPAYDWFYKVTGTYISWVVKENLKPHKHFRETHEPGFDLHNQYSFNHLRSEVYSTTQNTKRPLQQDTVQLNPDAFDILTATYFVRNLDYGKMKINDTVPVTVLLDNEYFDIFIRYLGKEIIEDKQDRIWKCMKFSALLVEGTIFTGGEDMTVWVTDDGNKIPVMVEAKILVGSVKAYLNQWSGTKYPMVFAKSIGQK